MSQLSVSLQLLFVESTLDTIAQVFHFSGKSFNSPSQVFSACVATRILLPRDGVRPAFDFHTTLRCKDPWRITCRIGYNGCCSIAVQHSGFLLLGVHLRQNKALQNLHSYLLHFGNNNYLFFHAHSKHSSIYHPLRGNGYVSRCT